MCHVIILHLQASNLLPQREELSLMRFRFLSTREQLKRTIREPENNDRPIHLFQGFGSFKQLSCLGLGLAELFVQLLPG